jgi:pyruvate dehydrogenase E2 component (dihydrolipoamide acetyltransferase)
MAVELALSKLGPDMESGTLTEWLVSDGDVVEEGQAVATVETDKVTTDLEAPGSGPITLLVEAGGEYPVGTRLAAIGADADADADGESASRVTWDPQPGNGASVAPPVTPAEVRAALAERRRGEPLATPIARRMAQALGIALADLQRTAEGRVIRKRDVEAAHAAATTSSAAAGRQARTADLSPMRRRIAQRMHASLQETAQITDFREHDVSELIGLRRSGVRWAGALGFRLSFTDLFVRATALALCEVPALNASLTENSRLISHGEINIGVAVALPDGLIVPVLRNVDQLDLVTVHQRMDDLVTRARAGRLTLDEVSGGTFTLTNIGSYGSHTATPLLVGGQVGIIGTGAFIEKPVVRDGQLAVGTVMHTSLTIDHRVVDGQTAGDFQTAWGRLIAEPDRLL